ncbi:MAG: AI-2E family transporter [Hyphomicrobiales bacterium]|nr:AI-2E family transporter [Hyphomicrobiales bacterium]
MIPLAVRDAWIRASRIEDEDDHPETLVDQQAHDRIVRYALVGICLILLLMALSLAKSIAVPLTAGLIFGLVLGPLVDWLIRLGVPQSAAAGLVVSVGVMIMVVIIGIFAAPFAIWSDQLPRILGALRMRFSDLVAVAQRVEGVAKDLTVAPAGPTVSVDSGSSWLSLAMTSSAAAGGVLIFVATIYFYLATRRHIKARALTLCFGSSARRSAGQFLADVESKLAAYFAVVTAINLGMGLIATLIAWRAGLPFPPFWGLLAFILNYIAFVGPVIMTGLLLGAILIDNAGTWWSVWPAIAYFVVHLIEGNVVTPVLVGRRLTLSPFLVFVSFVFWLWLWGPVGAILSVPLLLLVALSFEAAGAYRKLEAGEAVVAPEQPFSADAIAARIASP